MDDKILLDMQKTLGRIEEMSISMKEDIAELKQKDISQSEDLEKAYAKAKARQDSIRDDLQHQIDANKDLILTVNNNIDSLNKNIEKIIKEFREGINKSLSEFNSRLTALETKKEKTLAKWYDRVVDKLVWIFIIGALVVLLKWLDAPTEIVDQIAH